MTAYEYSCLLMDRFEAETGKPVLNAWYEYEEWLIKQPDIGSYVDLLNESES